MLVPWRLAFHTLILVFLKKNITLEAELKLKRSHPLGFGDTWPIAKEHWRNTTTGRAVPLLHLHHMAPWHPNRLRKNLGTYGTYGYSSPVKWQAKRASGLHIAHLGVVCQIPGHQKITCSSTLTCKITNLHDTKLLALNTAFGCITLGAFGSKVSLSHRT